MLARAELVFVARLAERRASSYKSLGRVTVFFHVSLFFWLFVHQSIKHRRYFCAIRNESGPDLLWRVNAHGRDIFSRITKDNDDRDGPEGFER